MMGRQSGQMSMMIMDLSELISSNHLLQRISGVISFDFICNILQPYYPSNGRPSIDPVSMFKMLLVGYLFGIKSDRCLVQEIQLNFAIGGSAVLSLQIKFRITLRSIRHDCVSGMKVGCFNRCFWKSSDAVYRVAWLTERNWQLTGHICQRMFPKIVGLKPKWKRS